MTLDSGALIAYERGLPRMVDLIALTAERGLVPTVPAVVVAETWRGRPRSARIARLLAACEVEELDEPLAREAGLLLGLHPGAGTVDALVAASALRRGNAVATSDPVDLRRLLGPSAAVIEV